MEDRWWGQAVYPSWWPSLTKDMQTEHELIRVNVNFIEISLLVVFIFSISWIVKRNKTVNQPDTGVTKLMKILLGV